MKIILMLLGFTCFGAGEDIYKVPEGKPRIFFDGTKWRTVSLSKQTTVLEARRSLPDLSKLFKMPYVDINKENQDVQQNNTYNDSVVQNLINKIMEGIKSGLRDPNIKEAFTNTIQTTPLPHPQHLFDWLLSTTSTSKKSYLDFLDTTTNQDTNDIQTIDAADLWYGTEPTTKLKQFYTNVQVQQTKTTPRPTVRNQMSINRRKQFDERIKKIYDLLSSYNEEFNQTDTNEEQAPNKTTQGKNKNLQIQAQINDLKNNRTTLIALIMNLLSKLNVILERQSKSEGLTNKKIGIKSSDETQEIIIKQKEPINPRKVAEQADSLFSELSYTVDLASEDGLSDTQQQIIEDMEEIDVRNEKYMNRMFDWHHNIPKQQTNEKEIYDDSQYEEPVDGSGGVEYETRYKIYNRTERGNILL